MDPQHKVSYGGRPIPPIYRELEKLVTPIAKDIAFRWSLKGTPHLLVELSNKTIYSLCYFKAYHYWKIFYPYGNSQEQQNQVFNTVEEILTFLRKETRKETQSA